MEGISASHLVTIVVISTEETSSKVGFFFLSAELLGRHGSCEVTLINPVQLGTISNNWYAEEQKDDPVFFNTIPFHSLSKKNQ
jgi:hypothetical protein